jgi:hypothetical protein
MNLSLLFTISSIYLALSGLGILISPTAMLAGALDPTALVVIDAFRGLGGAMFGIAIINWMARNGEASKVRDGIVLGNTVGFAFATAFSVLSWLHGYPAFGWVLIVLNLVLTVGFFAAGKVGMSNSATSRTGR